MKRYHFVGPKGGDTIVDAEDERDARDKAMWERNGAPTYPNRDYTQPKNKKGEYPLAKYQYSGLGLTLVSVSEVPVDEPVKKKTKRSA